MSKRSLESNGMVPRCEKFPCDRAALPRPLLGVENLQAPFLPFCLLCISSEASLPNSRARSPTPYTCGSGSDNVGKANNSKSDRMNR